MIDQLSAQHRSIMDIADELRRRVSVTEFAEGEALSRCRWRLHHALTVHLALEDEHLYARMATQPEFADIAALRQSKQAISALIDFYREHFDFWTFEKVEANWAAYRVAVTDLLNQLSDRVAWEELHLYPAVRAVIARRPVRDAA